MFPAVSSLTLLLLALSITGSPVEVRNSPVTLPIVGRLNFSNSTLSLLQHDKARVAAFKDPSRRSHTGGTPVTNSNVALGYIAAVGVGSPPTTYNLVVDTGSSNTWVGATAKYVITKTSVNTHQPVEVDYGSGSFSGTEYIDTITLGSGLTITKQSIGVASTSSGFTGVDGILGLGPVDLTEGTLAKLPAKTVPTVTDNLHSQGTIPQDVISVFFEPSSSQAETKGELTFGGTDGTRYTGDIAYTPITASTESASAYWGINESITYGSTTILSSTAGIVDTGTTLLLIATDALAKYQSATGATSDKATGLLTVSSAKYSALKNLDFHIGKETYSLTPNAQIWPRSLNSYIGGTNGVIYLVVSDIGSPSGQGLDFINGYTFLQRFYSVYDTANSRVGFAKTLFTDATTN